MCLYFPSFKSAFFIIDFYVFDIKRILRCAFHVRKIAINKMWIFLSIHQSFCPDVFMSIYTSTYLSLCSSTPVTLSFYQFVWRSSCLSVCLSANGCAQRHVCLNISLSAFLSKSQHLISLELYWDVSGSTNLSASLSVYLAFYMFVCLPIAIKTPTSQFWQEKR